MAFSSFNIRSQFSHCVDFIMVAASNNTGMLFQCGSINLQKYGSPGRSRTVSSRFKGACPATGRGINLAVGSKPDLCSLTQSYFDGFV